MGIVDAYVRVTYTHMLQGEWLYLLQVLGPKSTK